MMEEERPGGFLRQTQHKLHVLRPAFLLTVGASGCSQVDKEKESIRFELTKTQAQIKEAESAIASQKAEIEKLNHIINEADSERLRQKKEYDTVINERDILGTQVSRNSPPPTPSSLGRLSLQHLQRRMMGRGISLPFLYFSRCSPGPCELSLA